MRRRRFLIAGLVLLMIAALCSCGRTYRIEEAGATDLIVSCPKSAKAGETVTVETKCVTDGWVEVTATGAEVEAVQGDLFQFVMPAQDVEVRVKFAWDDLS